MNNLPKGPRAARLRQRKFELIDRFHIPAELLPGSLSLSHFRCGKPTCHCSQDQGHPAWSFTFMVDGKKQVRHIPKELVPEIQKRKLSTETLGSQQKRAHQATGYCSSPNLPK